MRALWLDKPNCSHNVSQKVKRISRFSDVSNRVPGAHGNRGLERGWRKRLAKGWRKVGEGLAKGWRRVGEGLADFLAPSSSLRAQRLKKFKILKFSSEIENLKRAARQTPIFFCGEF